MCKLWSVIALVMLAILTVLSCAKPVSASSWLQYDETTITVHNPYNAPVTVYVARHYVDWWTTHDPYCEWHYRWTRADVVESYTMPLGANESRTWHIAIASHVWDGDYSLYTDVMLIIPDGEQYAGDVLRWVMYDPDGIVYDSDQGRKQVKTTPNPYYCEDVCRWMWWMIGES